MYSHENHKPLKCFKNKSKLTSATKLWCATLRLLDKSCVMKTVFLNQNICCWYSKEPSQSNQNEWKIDGKVHFHNFILKLFCIYTFRSIIFLISQSKHMLWVLERIVSIRRFFWAPKTNDTIDRKENMHNFTLKNFMYPLWRWLVTSAFALCSIELDATSEKKHNKPSPLQIIYKPFAMAAWENSILIDPVYCHS